MLSARKLFVPIEILDWNSSIKCNVVFNTFKGNVDRYNPWTWDEPPEYDDVEIVDVFCAEEPCDITHSLYRFMSDKEVDYLKDLIVAVLEDEKLLGV